MDQPSERDAVAWLCSRLELLRAKADEGGWVDRLDVAVRRVRKGGSAVAACRQLGYQPVGDAVKDPIGDASSLGWLGLRSEPVDGAYICPKAHCSRREELGPGAVEPRCDLDDAVMAFRPTGAPRQ
jgi:hypothetical protein